MWGGSYTGFRNAWGAHSAHHYSGRILFLLAAVALATPVTCGMPRGAEDWEGVLPPEIDRQQKPGK